MASLTKQAVAVDVPPESSRNATTTATANTARRDPPLPARRRRWSLWCEPSSALEQNSVSEEQDLVSSTSVASSSSVPHTSTLIKGTLSTSQHHVVVDSLDQEPEARFALSARNINCLPSFDDHRLYDPTLGVLVDHHSQYFADPSHQEVIKEGGVLFSFSCSQTLDAYDIELVMNTINLSCFDDETIENFVPRISQEDLKHHTVVIARSCYLLPNIDLGFVCDPALLSSAVYQKACEPKSSYIWEDGNEVDTFRITKPVIPFIFSITIQFRVSRVKQADLDRFSSFLGLKVDGGLLMERTKRSKVPKEDRTHKIKSVLLYTKVPGGLYVTHLTAILQSSLPSIVAKVVHGFGAWGLTEALETAGKTRRFLDDQQQSSTHTAKSNHNSNHRTKG